MARRAPGPKPMLAAQLGRRLEREAPPPVVVVAGADRWLREASLRALVARVFPEGDPGGAFLQLDARATEDRQRAGRALEELRSASLFSSARLVAVTQAEATELPPEEGRKRSVILRLVEGAIEQASPGAVLVLLTAQPTKGKGGLRADALLAAGAWVVDCRPLYDAPGPWERNAPPHDHELARYLVGRMRARHGKRLALEDAHALTRLVGSELGELEGALASLALFAGSRDTVRSEDLEAALGATREDPLWRLSDAVFDRDRVRALEITTATFERGLSDARGAVVSRPEALFSMLVATLHGAYRRVLAGSEALARGEAPAEVARAQGIPSFRAEPFLARCRRDPEALLAANAAFVRAEQGVKGGGVPPRLAAERLIVDLLQTSERAPRARVPGDA